MKLMKCAKCTFGCIMSPCSYCRRTNNLGSSLNCRLREAKYMSDRKEVQQMLYKQKTEEQKKMSPDELLKLIRNEEED